MTKGTRQKRCRTHDVNDPRRWRKQRDKEAHDRGLCFFASAAKKLTRAILLEPFKRKRIRTIDELVCSLDEFLLQLLQLGFLSGPVPGVGGSVDGVYILVVLNQSLYCLGRQLEGNFVPGDHVDMYDVCLEMDHLIVEQRLHVRVVILLEL